jgi:hypothetical protein
MRTIIVSRRVLGWLGLLATVAVAGCTATSTSSPAAPGHGRSASLAAATAVSPGAASGSASAEPGGARNLAVSRAVRNELTAAYADFRGISLSDVAGTEPGSVYYAYDPATDTYWARATFVPSSTASFKVLVGFQDGASIGLFTRAARSGWQVELGGEPVVCAEVVFFPPAVLRAWSLSTATAASFGCSSQPARQLSSETFAATISIPADWQPTPDYVGQFAYDGPSGWVELDAATDPSGLHSACTGTAGGTPASRIYGLHPQIIYRTIDGRPGCLIFPSSDAPRLPRRTGYPAFQNSAALVEYRQPVSAGGNCISQTGQRCLYSLLVIDADPAHLMAIADSVQLHH